MGLRTTVSVAAVLVLAGCGGGESEPSATEPLQAPETTAEVSVDVVACDGAVADAVEAGQADAEALRTVFEACLSVEEFTAASGVEDLTGGEDPEAFVQQQCEQDSGLAESRLCGSL